jgi:hypothetical protein
MDALKAPKQFGEMVIGLILLGALEMRLLLEVYGKWRIHSHENLFLSVQLRSSSWKKMNHSW